MKSPRFAVAVLISALAAAPAFSQPLADPLAPAAGSIMDPASEGILMGLGQSMIPALDAPSSPAAKKAPPIANKPADASDSADAADLVAIGGQIINPNGSFHSQTGMNLSAAGAAAVAGSMLPRQATFNTHIDASGTAPAHVGTPTGLSYVHSQNVEATLGGKENAFGTDPKLSADDGSLSPGGTRASANH